MDKARRKFAILQEELSTANPSELKYQVRIRLISMELSGEMTNLLTAFWLTFKC